MIEASLLTLHQNIISKICFTLIRSKTYFFRVINFHFEMTSSQDDHRLPAILIFVDFCLLIHSFVRQITLYVVRMLLHEYLISSSFFIIISFRIIIIFGVF